MPTTSTTTNDSDQSRSRAGRAVEIAAAAALSIVAAPLVAVMAVGSMLVLRSWPFFVQERVGYGGRRFRFVKIRTLPTSIGPYVDKYHLAGQPVSVFARWLRRSKLDELPQLFLVVSGKMSLVGPRPEMPSLHRALDPEFARRRTSVRPGCTGLWQLGPSSIGLIGEAPEYDEFYLRHRGLRLDLWVLLQTVRTLAGGAPVPLEAVPAWARRQERADVSGLKYAAPSQGRVAAEKSAPRAESQRQVDLTLQRVEA